ncbi:MAG: RHS repeat-associated core domain-containing protein [Actinobacteria bacterium]|nr:RHS repeat-associated core domain-containing protein [Actinomycetota bacterium]
MAGTVSETYTYAGDGVRLSAVRGNRPQDVTRFLVDRSFGLPQLALERDGNGKLLRRYTYGLDLLAQTTPTKGPYWYHHDGLGSVSDVTSPGGASLWWMEYTPFGAARASASTSQAPLNFFRFTGEYADTATALYHLRARQYDRSTGRFLSTDQLIPPLTDPYVGAYVYVRNNPCRYVDPAGLAQTPTAGGSCPIAAFAAALGLSGLGSVDVALGLGAIFLAPSVLGELALLPAEAAALYLHYVLIELALQAATRDCSQIRIEINPFR